MKILGISCYYHDSAASLVVDGRVVAAAQEERFSRIKNDANFPTQSVVFCLKQSNISLTDLDAVVFYEKPLLKFDRLLETYLSTQNISLRFFVDTFLESTHKTLFLRSHLEKALKSIDKGFDSDRLLFSEHHLSHAASAFFPSPFEEAAVLTMDGLGEWATTTVSIGEGNSLHLVKEIHFPHSLGLFYSTLTSFCGFKVNSGEYKLMGLAPYGKPIYKDLILKNLITLRDDGSFELNLKYFDFSSTQKMFAKSFVQLFNTQPRTPETHIEQIYMDIAASTQAVLNAAILNITKNISSELNTTNLCLAGGVALNCVSNTQILKQGFFKNVWVQPAAGDAGGALGAALAAHSLHFKKPRHKFVNNDAMSFAYLGTEYSEEDILKTLQSFNLVFEKLDENTLIEKTALALAAGQSIGWFQGRMEFGPRALGSRSILADPRPPEMQKKLNLQIKFRESFRPFAPIVLEEKAHAWFEGIQSSSPYMLFVDDVRQERQKALPAITHLDGTARLQTVSKEQNSRLHQLLSIFEEKTGVPVLINTSFNVRGEPIVESPADAVRCFLKTEIDCLVLGDFIIEKSKNLDKKISSSPSTSLD
ncbi:carbamoyltransferase [bacterium]|nr:carbamoyltransferase [bacterium]